MEKCKHISLDSFILLSLHKSFLNIHYKQHKERAQI
jgi:hypothetical protein